jgi:hypothetical protein
LRLQICTIENGIFLDNLFPFQEEGRFDHSKAAEYTVHVKELLVESARYYFEIENCFQLTLIIETERHIALRIRPHGGGVC